MFKPSMAELGLCMYQLDTLVQEHIPDLYVHFQSQAIHTNLYASSWFLTLFTTSLFLPIACRVMDVFLSEGIEVIFRLSLALLLRARAELLHHDMEGVFTLAFSLNINQKKMKSVAKEYTSMKCKEKEDLIEIRRLQNENRLLRQRINLLETESNELADKLIQGQVDRAEVEENTFVLKQELSAAKLRELDTSEKLEEALAKVECLGIRIETEDTEVQTEEKLRITQEQVVQREEMMSCLKEELVKARQREAASEERVRQLREEMAVGEGERRRRREEEPEPGIAALQEQLAASKLREAEAGLALRELRTKVGQLNTMWGRHLSGETSQAVESDSAPKKLLGGLLEGKGEVNRLEEELMTSRLREVEGMAELKELRLKVMDLEGQGQVYEAQLRRQESLVRRLEEQLEEGSSRETGLAEQVEAAQRKAREVAATLEEVKRREKAREQERRQVVAELANRVTGLEYQKEVLSSERGEKLAGLESLRQQVALVIEPLPDKRKTSLNVVPQSL